MISTSRSPYERQLERRVLLGAATGVREFPDLLLWTEGAWPGDVRMALSRLFASGRLSPNRAAALLAEHKYAVAPYLVEPDPLGDPHPLESGWRFTSGTAERLADMARRASAEREAIILLGVPTVLLHVQPTPSQEVYLLERGERTLRRLRSLLQGPGIVPCDIGRDPLPSIAAGVVIADPPWYPEDLRLFLWTSASLAKLGATVLLSVPPVLVRPGIRRERRAMTQYAGRCGLRLIGIHPGALRYTTPRFERNALVAAGFEGDYRAWRCGDLAVLRREAASLPRRPRVSRSPSWRFVDNGSMSVAFREDWPRVVDPRLTTLVRGDVLPTVSRRAVLRPHVRVWTSGNRVFGCEDPLLAASIMQALLDDLDPLEVASRHVGAPLGSMVRRAVLAAHHQLEELLGAEVADCEVSSRAHAG